MFPDKFVIVPNKFFNFLYKFFTFSNKFIIVPYRFFTFPFKKNITFPYKFSPEKHFTRQTRLQRSMGNGLD